MSLARDLLAQASYIAEHDATRPRQASLRRCISTAYYAVFHLLIEDAMRRVAPARPAGLKLRIARAFAHAEMARVCRAVSAGTLPTVLQELCPQGFSVDLVRLAALFVELQEQRHEADYNLAVIFSKTDTSRVLQSAEDAFALWKKIRLKDEATVFLAALLFHGRWSR